MQDASSLGPAANLAEHRSRQGARDAHTLAHVDGSQTAQGEKAEEKAQGTACSMVRLASCSGWEEESTPKTSHRPRKKGAESMFCRSARVIVHHDLHSTSTEKPPMDIVALFQCLQPSLPSRTWRQLSRIAVALLVMTGRVTMLGISRWTGKGGSYRTVQRFFSTVIPWAILFWVFFRHHVYCPDEVYLAAGDEVIVTKAGKCTCSELITSAALLDYIAAFDLDSVRIARRSS